MLPSRREGGAFQQVPMLSPAPGGEWPFYSECSFFLVVTPQPSTGSHSLRLSFTVQITVAPLSRWDHTFQPKSHLTLVPLGLLTANSVGRLLCFLVQLAGLDWRSSGSVHDCEKQPFGSTK